MIPWWSFGKRRIIKGWFNKITKEKIGFENDFEPRIIHYYDEIKEKNNELIHNLEIDFIVNVDRSKVDIKLSDEHSGVL